jgi:single-stranded DNA-binding protein
MNSVGIIGRVGKAPKIGNGVATFRLALGSGDKAQWFSVACFGGALEAATKLWQGALVGITGYLRVNTYEGSSRVEIVATFVETLSKKPAGEPGTDVGEPAATAEADEPPVGDADLQE